MMPKKTVSHPEMSSMMPHVTFDDDVIGFLFVLLLVYVRCDA
jgi:hypothetical protein